MVKKSNYVIVCIAMILLGIICVYISYYIVNNTSFQILGIILVVSGFIMLYFRLFLVFVSKQQETAHKKLIRYTEEKIERKNKEQYRNLENKDKKNN